MIEEVGRFQAVSDDGEVFTVVEFQAYTEFRPVSGGAQRPPSEKRLELADGRHVNYIDSETFEIVETDQIIRKI